MEQSSTLNNSLSTERIGKLMVRFAVPSIISFITVIICWEKIFKTSAN